MLLKGFTRIVVVVGPVILLLVLFTLSAFRDLVDLPTSPNLWKWNLLSPVTNDQGKRKGQDRLSLTNDPKDVAETHTELFSTSTTNGKYFPIDFGSRSAINPNIIPHPSIKDTWIIVAMQQKSSVNRTVWFAELVCNAAFTKGKLSCIEPPLIMPIAATSGDYCTGELDFFTSNIGPHDARVFFGPKAPYTIYGSNSKFTCFGQWIQDFRTLTDWGFELYNKNEFRQSTELQRPAPWQEVEKNWFIFWDVQGKMYAHYDMAPKRAFAELQFDGSVGPDLAPKAEVSDERCMNRYMPQVGPELESIHQATNSLSITLCKRSDESCQPNDFNTFIFTIFQFKTFYQLHSVYEPYVMLFKQTAPFQIHAISQKPLWIHGRGRAGEIVPPKVSPQFVKGWNQTEMLYITSMSWKTQGQKYHGYVDDLLFIAFGVEDAATGGIDVVAEDLMKQLGLCDVF